MTRARPIPIFALYGLQRCSKAARDFGLDQGVVNAIALASDPRRPDLEHVAGALAEALLARELLVVPNAA